MAGAVDHGRLARLRRSQQLPRQRADVAVALARRQERLQVIGLELDVEVHEQQPAAPCGPEGLVGGAGETDVAAVGDHLQLGVLVLQSLQGAVGGGVVHDDPLLGLAGLLQEAVQAAGDHVAAVPVQDRGGDADLGFRHARCALQTLLRKPRGLKVMKNFSLSGSTAKPAPSPR